MGRRQSKMCIRGKVCIRCREGVIGYLYGVVGCLRGVLGCLKGVIECI